MAKRNRLTNNEITYEQVLELLRARCDEAGSQAAFARELGVGKAFISNILGGKNQASKRVLDALGVECVYRKKMEGK